MPWTAPKTWVADTVLTAADLNTHVRDNLEYVYDEIDDINTDLGGIATAGTLEKSAFPGGTIVQVVQTVKTDTFTTTSTSYTDITGLTVAITPSSTNNKVLILATLSVSPQNTGTQAVHVRLNGGNADDFVGNAAGSRTRSAYSLNRIGGGALSTDDSMWSVTLAYVDSPSSTSPVTYAVQLATPAGDAVYVNRSHDSDTDSNLFGRAASSIIALEVKG